MKKDIKIAKRSQPHYKKEKAPVKKGAQSRKSGKGTSLMHAAAKKQSAAEAAESNVSPQQPQAGRPSLNRADYELAQLTKRNAN